MNIWQSQFRRAIVMAMDKESFCNELLSGSATPTNGMFPASLPYGDDALTGATEYDMDGAIALLEEEGYTLENGQLLDADGEQVTMRIVSTTSPCGNSAFGGRHRRAVI